MTGIDRLRRPQPPSGHLGEAVHDYLDDRLPPATRHRADQHLLVCGLCRARVEQERALVAVLRSCPTDPGRHARLRAGLLDLARTETTPERREPEPPRRGGRSAPGVLDRTAPAQYRSVRSGLTAATLAVVGCAGVAVVVVVTSNPVQAPAPGRAPAVQVRPASTVVPDVHVGGVAAQRADVDARDAVRRVSNVAPPVDTP